MSRTGSSRLPSGWTEVPLGDLAEVIRGVTYRKEQASDLPADGTVPVLRSGNIGDHLNFYRLKFVAADAVRADQMLQVGDIVLSMSNSRELVGKASMLRHAWVGTFGAFCSVVRPVPSINPRFLGYYLQSPSYRAYIGQLSAATNNIFNLRKAHLAELVVPLPPRHEQDRIADALEEHRQKVTNGQGDVRAALELLRQMRASCLAASFEHAEAEVHELDGVASVQSGITKSPPKGGDLTRVPYIRTANVQAGFLDLDEIKQLPVTDRQRARHLLKAGDVLVLEGGDADKVGRGWIWSDEVPGAIHQNHVFAVRPDPDRLDPRYLAYYVNAPQARTYFLSKAKQTTNLASINKTQLRALPIPLPQVQAQREIAQRLDQELAAVADLRATVADRAREAQALHRALLHAAFRGKLVPQDLTDEPVSELLRRIRDDRTASELRPEGAV